MPEIPRSQKRLGGLASPGLPSPEVTAAAASNPISTLSRRNKKDRKLYVAPGHSRLPLSFYVEPNIIPTFHPAFVGQRRVFVRKRRKVSFDPKIFLAQVGEGKTIAKYQRGQIVFSQGDVADAVFYIQKGKVKLTVISEQGKEAVIAILEPGHFFGEGCLNGHGLRVATTAAMEECVITRIAKSVMIAAIHREPDFSELFMSYLLARNGRIEADLIDQLFNSSERRLARLLLLLANFGKEARPEPIVGKISQETLAEMVGTTRSRVSFFMNKFRKLGYIDYNGHLEVHNSLLNVVLYDWPEIHTSESRVKNR
jgi:CRP/FNR family transcriptional regulator, cyclic AMP receptor protein